MKRSRIARTTPLARSKRVRKVNAGRQSWRKILDPLCRAVVFARDGNRCVKTGKTENLQWAHVYSRRYHSLRWDTDNGLCLNAGAHLWAHHKPLEFAEWFLLKYPERHQRLMLRSRCGKGKIDHAGLKLYLEAELKRLT